MIYEKLPFGFVEQEVRRIFNNQEYSDKLNLSPDSISVFAELSGATLKWRPILNWVGCFEFNTSEFTDKDFLQIAFTKVNPSNGQTIVVTDECFKDQMAFSIFQFKDMIHFMGTIYPELFDMHFAQPSDYIFIQPQVKLITMVHHEGVRTKYLST